LATALDTSARAALAQASRPKGVAATVIAFWGRHAETLLASGVGFAALGGAYAVGSSHAWLAAEVSTLTAALAAEHAQREKDVATERTLREHAVATERELRATEKAKLEALLQAERELRSKDVSVLSAAQTARGGWWPR
jgi:hypothetical protein